MSDMFRLDGKIALVTGSSQGIGNALAQGLLPALPRDGGDRPVGVGERDRLRDRLPAEDGIAAGKDLGRCVVVCISASIVPVLIYLC